MGTRLKWIAFGLMVLFQLALPGWMFVQRERVLTEGAILLFRTAPIDPRDPFRGEYVALNFEAETGQWAAPAATHADEARRSAYAVFVTDSAGFAHITRLTTERPVDSTYVRVEFMVFGTEGVHRVSLPFDRFYLEVPYPVVGFVALVFGSLSAISSYRHGDRAVLASCKAVEIDKLQLEAATPEIRYKLAQLLPGFKK